MTQSCPNSRRVFVILCCIAFAGWVYFFFVQSKEPVYQGRRLTQWLESFDTSSGTSRALANKAVREIGTNALPVLVKMLSGEKTWKQKAISTLDKQPLIKIPKSGLDSTLPRALSAFQALGETAKPAVPLLSELLKREDTAYQGAFALAAIGPDGVSCLVEALTNESTQVRVCAAWALGSISFTSPPVVIALVKSLDDPHFNVRLIAARSLGQIHQQPDIGVAALARTIRDTNALVRKEAVTALGLFGENAKLAVPLLEMLARDPNDPVIQETAKDSLARILQVP
jgi:hypothetical protein